MENDDKLWDRALGITTKDESTRKEELMEKLTKKEDISLTRKQELLDKYVGKEETKKEFIKGLTEEERESLVHVRVILYITKYGFNESSYHLLMKEFDNISLEMKEIIINDYMTKK